MAALMDLPPLFLPLSAGCLASQATEAPLSLEVGRRRRVEVEVCRLGREPDSVLGPETPGTIDK